MVSMKVKYLGEKHCELAHGPSNSMIETDAPKDNNGRGEKFSPTDLVGAALGSCMLTTMAILCEKEGFNLKGSYCEVEKEMIPNPRRIGTLHVKLYLPEHFTIQERHRLEEIARNCPVTKSLHPDLKILMEVKYESI